MQTKNKTLYIRAAIILIGVVLALLAFAFSHLGDVQENTDGVITSIKIGDNIFSVLIADTYELRQKGLSDRPSLEEDEGMLFIFEESAVRGFWMKDMMFPLDMIWIDENKKIVGITQNVMPESYPESFSSTMPVQYVLEVNANVSKKRSIIIGEEVEFIKD